MRAQFLASMHSAKCIIFSSALAPNRHNSAWMSSLSPAMNMPLNHSSVIVRINAANCSNCSRHSITVIVCLSEMSSSCGNWSCDDPKWRGNSSLNSLQSQNGHQVSLNWSQLRAAPSKHKSTADDLSISLSPLIMKYLSTLANHPCGSSNRGSSSR